MAKEPAPYKPNLNPQPAPLDAKPLDTTRPPPIVPDAPTIDEWTIDGRRVKNRTPMMGPPRGRPSPNGRKTS